MNLRFINEDELDECLKLLDPKYHNLNIKIKFYYNRLHVFVDYLRGEYNKEDFKLVMKSEGTCACYRPYINQGINILVYSFNRNKYYQFWNNEIKYKKIQVMYDIYHEIRHAYQHQFAPKKFNEERIAYISSGEGYSEQWIERDANRFSRAMMGRHKDSISKIVNLESKKWNVGK